MFLIDTHCHVNKLNYKNKNKKIKKILKNSFLNNIKIILSVSTSIKDFYENQKIIQNYKNILLSCGLHPLKNHQKNDIKILKSILHRYNIIAIGETGLDFYQNNFNKNKQIKLFEQHIEIAKKKKKPLIIHSRKSKKEIMQIISKNNKKNEISGVLHSFTEDINMARKLLDNNFYISFSGIITFKNSKNLRKILNYIPIERLLIETDSPYLTPEPYRKYTNQPTFLYYIAQKISKRTKINFFTLIKQIEKNFFELFKIKK